MCTREGQREWKRESPKKEILHAEGADPLAQHGAQTNEPLGHDLTRNQECDAQLTEPPLYTYCCFYYRSGHYVFY